MYMYQYMLHITLSHYFTQQWFYRGLCITSWFMHCIVYFSRVHFDVFNIHRNKGPQPTSLYDVTIRPRDVVGKWSTPIMSQTPRSNSYEDYFKEINDIASSTDGENEEEEVTKTPDGKMWRGRGRVGITQVQ